MDVTMVMCPVQTSEPGKSTFYSTISCKHFVKKMYSRVLYQLLPASGEDTDTMKTEVEICVQWWFGMVKQLKNL